MQTYLRDKHLYPVKTTSQLPFVYRKNNLHFGSILYGKSIKEGKSLNEAYGVHILLVSRAKCGNKHASYKDRMKS